MSRRNVLVTGATGFIGGAVARHLAARGDAVTGTGRRADAGRALAAHGVAFAPCDLTDAAAAAALCRDRDLVIHAAALAAPFGPEAAFRAANVTATENVVAGALAGGVGRLVHVSTPSLYHTGRDRFGVREDEPLPPFASMHPYARTKAMAEAVVARGRASGLAAVVLRPRAVFGPGDTTILPRLARALRRARLPVIGDGATVCDLTHVDNVVHAVVLASAETAPAAGTYNVTNGEPVRLWDAIRRIAADLGLPSPRGRVPLGVALAAAAATEAVYRVLRPGREPPITRHGVALLGTSMTLDLTAARRDLGYAPVVSMDEGLAQFAREAR